jgi:hypothetical protein
MISSTPGTAEYEFAASLAELNRPLDPRAPVAGAVVGRDRVLRCPTTSVQISPSPSPWLGWAAVSLPGQTGRSATPWSPWSLCVRPRKFSLGMYLARSASGGPRCHLWRRRPYQAANGLLLPT